MYSGRRWNAGQLAIVIAPEETLPDAGGREDAVHSGDFAGY